MVPSDLGLSTASSECCQIVKAHLVSTIPTTTEVFTWLKLRSVFLARGARLTAVPVKNSAPSDSRSA